MSVNPKISIIIPSYNEAENFKLGKMDEVHDYMKNQAYSWEVIVVDDGSTDETPKLLADFVKDKKNWKFVKNTHNGKAETVLKGFSVANGDIQLFTDFDQATPITYIEEVIKKVESGSQVVIGSREIGGAKRYKEPLSRHVIGRVFNVLVQILALRGISDSQCGFKAFTKETLKDLLDNLIVYKNKRKVADAYFGALDVELLFLARKKGYKITQIPVNWTYVESTRLNAIKNATRMFSDILKIRLNYILGRYRS